MQKIENKLLFYILIILGASINPLTVFLFTPSTHDSPLNFIQIVFIQGYFLITAIFIKRKKVNGKTTTIYFLILLASVILLENVFSRTVFLIIVATGLFIYGKKGFIINHKREIFLTITLFLLLFYSLEIFSRIYLMKPEAILPNKIYYIREFSKAGLIQKASEGKLIYELRPNLNSEFSFSKFITNSEGLLDKEYNPKKPLNKTRIALVGDSTSAAIGVEPEEAYPVLLENGCQKCEVINFAVPGYNFYDYLEVIKHKVLKYRPDIIIISFLPTNDFIEPTFTKKSFEIKTIRTNSFFRWWSGKFIRDSFKNIVSNPEKKIIEKNFNESKINETFFEINEIRKKHNVEITFVALARWEEREFYPQEYSLLKKYTQKYNFYLIETADKFKKIPYEDTISFRMDRHANKGSQTLFKDAILEQLNLTKMQKKE